MPNPERKKALSSALALLAALACGDLTAARADLFRASDGKNLLLIADVGGQPTLVNAPTRLGAPVSNGDDVLGLAAKPGTGELWLVTYDGVLATVAPGTGKLTRKATIKNHRLVDLAFAASGQLYGVSSCRDQADPSTLFAVSPTGALTKVTVLAPADVCQDSWTGALAFGADGRLFFAAVGADDHPYVDAINLTTLAIARVFTNEDMYSYPTASVFTSAGRLRISDYGYLTDLDLDTGEFEDVGMATTPGLLGNEYVEAQGLVSTTVPCAGTKTALCFLERFRVEVAWGPSSTPALASLRSASEGSFSFGPTGLADVTVRLTNTCATKAKYGFYASGPTNAKLALKVTDTKTGTIKTFSNVAGVAFVPILQPAAFNCP